MHIRVYKNLTESGFPTAVALGCFDGLHLGHRKVIGSAVEAKQGGLVPTVCTFDASPQLDLCGKGASNLMTNERKILLLEEIGVEQVYLLPFSKIQQLSSQEFAEQVLKNTFHAKKVCCGFNFHFGKGGKAGSKELAVLCREMGMETAISEKVELMGETVSSTRIRKLIENGEVTTAARLMGRCFGFDFEVVHGRKLGRELGTPTINQPFPENYILPKFGVYASTVKVGDSLYCGVTNVGIKPTVGSDRVLAETWIPDFSGDLYGKRVLVELLSFIRPEKKFDSLEKLKEEIIKNGDESRKIMQNWHLQKESTML